MKEEEEDEQRETEREKELFRRLDKARKREWKNRMREREGT